MTGGMSEQVLAFTKGDPVRALNLQRALETIRKHSSDPRAAMTATAVLEGRMSVRALANDPHFAAEVSRRVAPAAARFRAMTPEQREKKARQGRMFEAKQRQKLKERQEREAREARQRGRPAHS